MAKDRVMNWYRGKKRVRAWELVPDEVVKAVWVDGGRTGKYVVCGPDEGGPCWVVNIKTGKKLPKKKQEYYLLHPEDVDHSEHLRWMVVCREA